MFRLVYRFMIIACLIGIIGVNWSPADLPARVCGSAYFGMGLLFFTLGLRWRTKTPRS